MTEDYEEQQAAMKTVAAKHVVKKEELTEEDIATAGRCYPFQRKTVIESSKDANPVIIFSQIPLENKKVFYNHLLQLTGHNFSESFNDITKKLKNLRIFLSIDMRKVLDEEKVFINAENDGVRTLLLLKHKFKEEKSLLVNEIQVSCNTVSSFYIFKLYLK